MSFLLLGWICWGAFGMVWVIGAIYNAIKGPSAKKRSGGRQWMIAIVLAWLATKAIPRTFWSALTVNSAWLHLLGAACLVVSTVFVIWARFTLGQLWSSVAIIKEGHDLRTTGPYRVTRHPIYTGLLGMIFGTTLINGFGYVLPIFVIAFIIMQIKIQTEERLLTETFGERYTEYKRTVPQLIPGLKFKERILR